MHWIRKMRLEKGWSQKELAKKAGCTAGLIDMLEEANGAVTHWEIANEIAGALGAGKAERDSIVPKERRDEPFTCAMQEDGELETEMEETLPIHSKGLKDKRVVVVFDGDGREIDRVVGYAAAAGRYGISVRTVENTLIGERPENEFLHRDISFRDAAEWDALGGESQMRKKLSSKKQRIVVIGRDGREIERLPCVWTAARKYNCDNKEIYDKCNPRTRPMNEFRRRDVTFRWAKDWDGGKKE